MSGSIGGSACPELNSLPVNAARPKVADMPQHNAADAMNRYPRSGFLFGEQLVESLGVKSDHHFFADHQRGCRAALVGVNEILNGFWIPADISFLVRDPFLRKVALGPGTRWSAWLRKQNYGFCHLCLELRIPLTVTISYFELIIPSRSRKSPLPFSLALLRPSNISPSTT